jgi:hypothetical protein
MVERIAPKYEKNNWRVIVTEKGSVYLDKIYEKVFIGNFTKDIHTNKELLLIELCERIEKKNKKYLSEYIENFLKGDAYGELR